MDGKYKRHMREWFSTERLELYRKVGVIKRPKLARRTDRYLLLVLLKISKHHQSIYFKGGAAHSK